ncbi:hypothetical protein LCM17_04505 [Cereibacter sphaeroides]|nr:hypothetical protein [Cereibacter sphaeroides]
MTPEALARQLWSGPLPDPSAPGRALLGRAEYLGVLAQARVLTRMGLPVDLPALQATFPWSIDLAWLSVPAARDAGPLQRAVTTEGRRHGALGWALWSLGQPAEALAVLEGLNPDAPSHAEDILALAELRILAGEDPGPLPEAHAHRLALLQTYRQQGAAALTEQLRRDQATLPPQPALWTWLCEVFLTELDIPAAQDALTSFAGHCPDHPALPLLRIRLSLAREDLSDARAHLSALDGADTPWTWPLRRHLLHLRCLGAEIARSPDADYAPLRAHAEAASRLFPRDRTLGAALLSARELTEDWDALAATLPDHPDPRAAAVTFLRLGLPDAALERLKNVPPLPPDEAYRLRQRRAEALKMAGRPLEAAEALGPTPLSAPLAADHAYWRAEIALASRDLPAAQAALAPALIAFPNRMGLHLSAARLAFLQGDDSRCADHLARFRNLKSTQTGQPVEDDLRDLITRDAATAPDGPGQAARRLALAPPAFTPDPNARIPRQIAHYWEGPRPPGLERSLRAWADLYPQRLFDAASARTWLEAHTALAPLFDRLTSPATRADLFRLALLAQDGGLFADLDEYPRASVEDWLIGARSVLVIEEGHGTLANNFLATQPQDPLFIHLRDSVADRLSTLLDRGETPYPWWDAGPAMLTRAAAREPLTQGRRFLTQPEYLQRVATNLPLGHKRSPDHWR